MIYQWANPEGYGKDLKPHNQETGRGDLRSGGAGSPAYYTRFAPSA
ncbi:MAG: hypothetical protein ACLTC4_07775 [Hungatella hathewayi]